MLHDIYLDAQNKEVQDNWIDMAVWWQTHVGRNGVIDYLQDVDLWKLTFRDSRMAVLFKLKWGGR